MDRKTTLIISAVVLLALAGGFWLSTSSDDASSDELTPAEIAIQEGEKPDSSLAGSDEQSEMPSEPSTEIGETVAIGDLKTPETFELPVYTNHFEITGSVDDGLTITLLAIINRPEQFAEYQQQLAQFKAEALQYLSDNGVDTEEVDITYSPESAAEL